MADSSLRSVATAVPPHLAEQRVAKEIGRNAFRGRAALFERLSGVFDNAEIATRHLVAPLDWYAEPPHCLEPFGARRRFTAFYTSMTSRPRLRRPAVNSCGARLSVIRRWILS